MWTSVSDTAVVGRACRFGREAIRFGSRREPPEPRSSNRSKFVGRGGNGGLISWEVSIMSCSCCLSLASGVVVEVFFGTASSAIDSDFEDC